MAYIFLFLSAFGAATLLPLQSESVLAGMLILGEYSPVLLIGEPYRVCRRVNILRDYPDDKIKIYP